MLSTFGLPDCHVGGGVLFVTTAWCVLRLRLEGSPAGTEGSCEYIE
jgi:hypothetical protein